MRRNRTYGFLRLFVPGHKSAIFSTLSSTDFKIHVYHSNKSRTPNCRTRSFSRSLSYIQPHAQPWRPSRANRSAAPYASILSLSTYPLQPINVQFSLHFLTPYSFLWAIFRMHKAMVSYYISSHCNTQPFHHSFTNICCNRSLHTIAHRYIATSHIIVIKFVKIGSYGTSFHRHFDGASVLIKWWSTSPRPRYTSSINIPIAATAIPSISYTIIIEYIIYPSSSGANARRRRDFKIGSCHVGICDRRRILHIKCNRVTSLLSMGRAGEYV